MSKIISHNEKQVKTVEQPTRVPQVGPIIFQINTQPSLPLNKQVPDPQKEVSTRRSTHDQSLPKKCSCSFFAQVIIHGSGKRQFFCGGMDYLCTTWKRLDHSSSSSILPWALVISSKHQTIFLHYLQIKSFHYFVSGHHPWGAQERRKEKEINWWVQK